MTPSKTECKYSAGTECTRLRDDDKGDTPLTPLTAFPVVDAFLPSSITLSCVLIG